MMKPLHRSGYVPDSFVNDVRKCDFVDDWSLNEDQILGIAGLLWDYKNDDTSEDMFRGYRNDARPKDRKAPLDKLASIAEQGQELLGEIAINPYLMEALVPAYRASLEDWPEEMIFRTPNFDDKHAYIALIETRQPTDAILDLLELEQRFSRLAKACREAKSPEHLPVFVAGRKTTSDKLQYVVIQLNDILPECIEPARERRACIGELLPLIGVNITDKRLHNML